MEWACERCGRMHEAPPTGGCLGCGRPAVVPAGEDDSDAPGAYLGRAHDAVFAPEELAVDLTGAGGLASVAFRVIVVVSTLFVLAVVLAALL